MKEKKIALPKNNTSKYKVDTRVALLYLRIVVAVSCFLVFVIGCSSFALLVISAAFRFFCAVTDGLILLVGFFRLPTKI